VWQVGWALRLFYCEALPEIRRYFTPASIYFPKMIVKCRGKAAVLSSFGIAFGADLAHRKLYGDNSQNLRLGSACH